jgi:membrane protein DedA with SNARE-associated domain
LCGAAGIAPLRFLRYNVATALAWALIFTALGACYGAGATAVFGRVAHYEAWLLLGSVVFGLAIQVAVHRLGKPRV